MLTYSLASNVARRANFDGPASAVLDDPRPRQAANVVRIDGRIDRGRRPVNGFARWPSDRNIDDVTSHELEITPANVVTRRTVAWDGIRVEIVQSITHDKVEFRFRAPCHLLLVYEEGVRDDGETRIEGLPGSTLQTLRRKLTFVPAGHEYREWQLPGVRSRVISFYLDPAKMLTDPDGDPAAVRPAPRLFFENNVLWDMAVKLAIAVEDGCEAERYSEALGVVVAYESLRLHGNVRRRRPPVRGGLAAWQQRIVAAYIEEHLTESISLGALAKLVNLSSYYFCRAFKQSFGVPPRRYHINRRIERAKTLLASPAQSVTDIALSLGFSQTSSFSAAFRDTTGTSPTEYRRTRT
jgi:AraC family transcriptional regulator